MIPSQASSIGHLGCAGARPVVEKRTSKALRVVVLSMALAFASVSVHAGAPIFESEELAQRHCPKDTVVWLNVPTHIYHFKGMRWYGRTNSGAYVCRADADKEGDRPTRNGQ